MLKCPDCGFEQPADLYCAQCGVQMAKAQQAMATRNRVRFGQMLAAGLGAMIFALWLIPRPSMGPDLRDLASTKEPLPRSLAQNKSATHNNVLDSQSTPPVSDAPVAKTADLEDPPIETKASPAHHQGLRISVLAIPADEWQSLRAATDSARMARELRAVLAKSNSAAVSTPKIGLAEKLVWQQDCRFEEVDNRSDEELRRLANAGWADTMTPEAISTRNDPAHASETDNTDTADLSIAESDPTAADLHASADEARDGRIPAAIDEDKVTTKKSICQSAIINQAADYDSETDSWYQWRVSVVPLTNGDTEMDSRISFRDSISSSWNEAVRESLVLSEGLAWRELDIPPLWMRFIESQAPLTNSIWQQLPTSNAPTQWILVVESLAI